MGLKVGVCLSFENEMNWKSSFLLGQSAKNWTEIWRDGYLQQKMHAFNIILPKWTQFDFLRHLPILLYLKVCFIDLIRLLDKLKIYTFYRRFNYVRNNIKRK